MLDVYPEDVADLADELQPLLKAELAAGNEIRQTWRGWPDSEAVVVMLWEPFRVSVAALPDGVQFEEVEDYHYWKAEYRSRERGHLLACWFGREWPEAAT